MASGRIIYQNWIVELGGDAHRPRAVNPDEPVERTGESEDSATEELRRAVRSALERLDEEEKELVIRVHFMGQSYEELSFGTGRAVHKLMARHDRAFRKLRRLLSPYVVRRYGLNIDDHVRCPICRSAQVGRINAIIAGRDRQKSWRPVIKQLRETCGLKIATPQILIGHEKYHMLESIKTEGVTHEQD